MLIFLCLPAFLKAQDKGDFYYQDHPEEILAIAKQHFTTGHYDRTLELCELHKTLLGEEHAQSADIEALRLQATDSQKLAIQLEKNLEDGHNQAARGVAEELRVLNPHDERLKQFGLYLAPGESLPETQQQADVRDVKPDVQDVKPDVRDVKPDVKDVKPDLKDLDLDSDESSPYASGAYSGKAKVNQYDNTPCFPVRLGFGLLNLGSTVAPDFSLSFGAYNLGESVVGFDAKLYGSWGLAEKSVDMYGFDLMLAIHIPSTPLYLKGGIGGFDCSDKNAAAANQSTLKHSTQGLCYPFGVALVLNGGFTIDAGVSFYPVVNVWQTKTYSTANKEYELPVATSVLQNPLSVWFGLGWAF